MPPAAPWLRLDRAGLCLVQPLSIPDPSVSLPQHPDGIQGSRACSAPISSVQQQGFSVLVGPGNPSCCSLLCPSADTESRKPFHERNQQWINSHQQCPSRVILRVSSSCRASESQASFLSCCFRICLTLVLIFISSCSILSRVMAHRGCASSQSIKVK